MKSFDLLVVGRGIAACSFLHYYQQDGTQIPNVAWVGPDPFKEGSLTCSTHSTSMVALQGIQKGLSPLGDTLVDSFYACADFVEKYKPAGVEKAQRYHLFIDDDNREKLVQRFQQDPVPFPFDSLRECLKEEAYLFSSEIFLKWWHSQVCEGVTVMDKMVLDVEQADGHWLVTFNDKQKVKARKVVLATGALGKLAPVTKPESAGSVVPGHYWQWSDVEFDSSFVVTLGGHNLIYRSFDKTLLLTGTSEKTGLLARESGICAIESLFQQHVPFLMSSKKPKLMMGIRHKGKKREPRFQEIDSGLYVVDRFYKNGYSFCHHLGKGLSDLVKARNL